MDEEGTLLQTRSRVYLRNGGRGGEEERERETHKKLVSFTFKSKKIASHAFFSKRKEGKEGGNSCMTTQKVTCVSLLLFVCCIEACALVRSKAGRNKKVEKV